MLRDMTLGLVASASTAGGVGFLAVGILSFLGGCILGFDVRGTATRYIARVRPVTPEILKRYQTRWFVVACIGLLMIAEGVKQVAR